MTPYDPLADEVPCDREFVKYSSLDGLPLMGTYATPFDEDAKPGTPVLLVHGITAERNEGGFYATLALALAEAGMPSLRFDLRGHGLSGGTQEELTLFGCVSDVIASAAWLCERTEKEYCSVVASSFGAGIAVLADQYFERMVLWGPNLDYRENWLARMWLLDEDDTLTTHRLTTQARTVLQETGSLPRGLFHMGPALVNEILHVSLQDKLDELYRFKQPPLIIVGTGDTVVDVPSIKRLENVVTIEGAEHGFIEPGDEAAESPITTAMRLMVITRTADYLRRQ